MTKQKQLNNWLETIEENLQEHFPADHRLGRLSDKELRRAAKQFAFIQIMVFGADNISKIPVFAGEISFDDDWALQKLGDVMPIDPAVAHYAIEQWLDTVGDYSHTELGSGYWDEDEGEFVVDARNWER